MQSGKYRTDIATGELLLLRLTKLLMSEKVDEAVALRERPNNVQVLVSNSKQTNKNKLLNIPKYQLI